MKKKSLMISMMLLLMILGAGVLTTGCSSDEDEFNEDELADPALKPLLGYWQYTGQTIDSRFGYVFKSSGEVLEWEVYWGEYKEWHFGTFGKDADQYLTIKGDSKENKTEGALYYITEVSSDSMTIHYPGWSDLLEYQKYKKLPGKP